MKQEVQYLLEIIKYILNKSKGELMVPSKDMDWGPLVQLAKAHSILNFVYYGIDCLSPEHKPDDEQCRVMEQALISSVVRDYHQLEGVKELFDAFEAEGVYALAVKGICTKYHYPATDLRTMGDIDILYQPQQDAKVKKVMQQLGYEQSMEGRKHDCYVRKPYLAVEMHRDLVEADSRYIAYYENIWERVKPKENYHYVQEMSLEDEYIYTLVHLARHFQDGGVGIRFVIDVYVYNHLKDMDWQYVEEELKKLQLWEFYENLSKLAEWWFGEKIPSQEDKELLEKLATYVIANGTFGTTRNAAAVSSARKGRFQALMREVFPSLKSMQSMYEWLKKYPVLLPYAWVLRGVCSITSKRRRKNIRYHVDKFKNADKELGEQLQRFFYACGLRENESNKQNTQYPVEISFLLQVVKFVLGGQKDAVPLPEKNIEWEKLFKIANKHGLSNILYYGVLSLPTKYRPNEKLFRSFQENAMYELVISCNQIEAVKEFSNRFEENGIYAVPLKGICTKQHYPYPEMRSMGDIDILYKEEQQKKIREIMKSMEYQEPIEGRVHDTYVKRPYVNVEAHRKLVSADSAYSSYYENIWDKLSCREGCQYVHEMSIEDEYIYNLVHLAGHFQNGGIGIRFVMDVYIYNQMKNINWDYVKIELKKLGLWEFYQNISKLATIWFGIEETVCAEDMQLLYKLSTYIISNGVFGSQRNSAAISVAQKGRMKFLIKSFFPDYRNMQTMFPWLKKWPILLPYSWVLRGIRSIMFRRNHIVTQLRRYKHGEKEYGEELKEFFMTCGLQK